MKLKKTVIFGLTTAMMLSSLPPVLADSKAISVTPSSQAVKNDMLIIPLEAKDDPEAAAKAKISKEKATELAQTYADIPDGYRLNSISFNSWNPSSSSGAWNLSFVKEEQERYYGNISVSVDGDSGKLLSLSLYENDPSKQPAFPPKVNLEQAKEIAWEQLIRYNPELQESVKYNDSNEKWAKPPLDGNVSYSIQFDRLINGIPFPSNYIQVQIDSEGKLTNYNYVWDNRLQFEEAAAPLSEKEAMALYTEKLSPSLSYIRPYQKTAKNTNPYLAYRINSFLLDVNSGKLITESGQETQDGITPVPLTEEPLAPKPASDQNLSEEQAVERVQTFFPLPAGAELTDVYYNENVDNQVSTWNLNWRIPRDNGRDYDYLHAAVNSKTGEIVNYGGKNIILADQTSAEQTKPKIDLDTAKQTAVDLVTKLLPHYSSELAINELALSNYPAERIEESNSYSVPFLRLVNGVVSEDESISVDVNLVTGEITNFWSNLLSAADYPDTLPDILTEQEAEDLLFAQYKAELQYYVPGYYGGQRDNKNEPKTGKAVYRLVPLNPIEGLFLDAETGDWRKREDGTVTKPVQEQAADLENHWASQALQLMIDYNAIDVVDGKVYPDQAITRGEMIKMLVIASNGGGHIPFYGANRKASFADVGSSSPYFSYVEMAVDSNLIDKSEKDFNPDSKMTREELAELITRALGYSKLAGHSSLFQLDVADSEQIQYKGHVAIVLGLGLLTPSVDGHFLPNQEVSRAQAATSFYRYLEKRASLKDTPVGY